MRVFMMIPSDEFVLKTGDIAYWIGHVPAKAVEKYIKQSRYENYIIYSSKNENLESKSGRTKVFRLEFQNINKILNLFSIIMINHIIELSLHKYSYFQIFEISNLNL